MGLMGLYHSAHLGLKLWPKYRPMQYIHTRRPTCIALCLFFLADQYETRRRRAVGVGKASAAALLGRGAWGAEERPPERREGDGAGERVGPCGGEHAVFRGQRAGRPPRVEQPRLLDRRRNPRLLPLGQTRAPAPEGAGGDSYRPSPLPLQHSLGF
jgi:hypothetical protein